eukprot:CAMPEP_0181362764 /NCGR_PEP_ID=MMETSP1106-20121128/8250_1 /TAXON_ID=81844 /ORGANISM="Mantoniella antarctica, Strain SL-175" /LENGTH=262 /DNA_ID=CAMNT_0023476879 /DNA_START=392 /DNA_END=1180 /DNA_ORIENTATION=+
MSRCPPAASLASRRALCLLSRSRLFTCHSACHSSETTLSTAAASATSPSASLPPLSELTADVEAPSISSLFPPPPPPRVRVRVPACGDLPVGRSIASNSGGASSTGMFGTAGGAGRASILAAMASGAPYAASRPLDAGPRALAIVRAVDAAAVDVRRVASTSVPGRPRPAAAASLPVKSATTMSSASPPAHLAAGGLGARVCDRALFTLSAIPSPGDIRALILDTSSAPRCAHRVSAELLAFGGDGALFSLSAAAAAAAAAA